LGYDEARSCYNVLRFDTMKVQQTMQVRFVDTLMWYDSATVKRRHPGRVAALLRKSAQDSEDVDIGKQRQSHTQKTHEQEVEKPQPKVHSQPLKKVMDDNGEVEEQEVPDQEEQGLLLAQEEQMAGTELFSKKQQKGKHNTLRNEFEVQAERGRLDAVTGAGRRTRSNRKVSSQDQTKQAKMGSRSFNNLKMRASAAGLNRQHH
jgi:hypothetical protein